MSSTTALNVRAAHYQVEDKRDYPDHGTAASDLSGLWVERFVSADMEGRPILYFPEINMGTMAHTSRQRVVADSRGYSVHARLINISRVI
jgi:hypothetical protein